MDNTTQTLAILDLIRDAYIGGGKSWEAQGKAIFEAADKLREQITGEKTEVITPHS